MTALSTTATPWTFFDTEVVAVVPLGASFARLTLRGADLGHVADNGLDQRFKMLFPAPSGGFEHLRREADWYGAWRALPEEHRCPIRTYTVRAVRPDAAGPGGELDVDMVRHGAAGPASAFAETAQVGDRVVVLGPDARFDGEHGGVEFRPPPSHRGPFLLAGDETALPAVAVILEQLRPDAFGEVVLEVPESADRLDLRRPEGMAVTWVVRDGASYGSGLAREVPAAVERLELPLAVAGQDLDESPADLAGADEVLWDVPEEAAADVVARSLYAWLAGEAAAITGLRRHLVREVGVDRRAVAFMGYWRAGRAAAS